MHNLDIFPIFETFTWNFSCKLVDTIYNNIWVICKLPLTKLSDISYNPTLLTREKCTFPLLMDLCLSNTHFVLQWFWLTYFDFLDNEIASQHKRRACYSLNLRALRPLHLQLRARPGLAAKGDNICALHAPPDSMDLSLYMYQHCDSL